MSVPFTVSSLPTGSYILSISEPDFPDAVYTIPLDNAVHTVLIPNGVSSTPSLRQFQILGIVSGISGGISTFSATNGSINSAGSITLQPSATWQRTPTGRGPLYVYPD